MKRKSTAMIVACLALFVALSGAGIAQAYTGEESPYLTPPKLPHIYSNGQQFASQKWFRMIGWGTVTLSNATTGPVECHSIFAEQLENPYLNKERMIEGKNEIYSGAAQGEWWPWGFYECSSPPCTSLGGQVAVTFAVIPPWGIRAELTELQGEPGVVRQHLQKLELTIACSGSPPTSFGGEVAPSYVGGGTSPVIPEEMRFDPGSGALTGADGSLTVAGALKIMGYGAQQLASARTP